MRMRGDKKTKWEGDLRRLRGEMLELRQFLRYRRVINWAANEHPMPTEDGGPILGHLWQVHHLAAAVLLRRIVKPNDDSTSLLWLLEDLDRFYEIAASIFPSLPPQSEIVSDAAQLRAVAIPIIDFVDEAYVHIDRNPQAGILEAFTRLDDAVALTLELGIRYVNVIGEGMSEPTPIAESDVRELFGVPWIDEDTAIPTELLGGQ